MTKTTLKYTALLLAVSGIVSGQNLQRDIQRTDEKEVKVKIESSFGSVNIAKGGTDKIAKVFYRRKEKERQPKLLLDYHLDRKIGELNIELHPEGVDVETAADGDMNVHVNNFEFDADEWYVQLVEGIPLSIDAELGAGESYFDFSGLTIDNLSISTGASSSKLRFDEKNRGEIRNLKIESGVSKFVADNLNNANFRTMEFEGGVGSYHLDFGGELKKEVKVDISVGLGSITVVVPKKIGLLIKYEDSWLSNLTLNDEEFVRKKKGVYVSDNYDDAEGRMDISIESGLGSVKIKRSK